jgi:valyl-tRNA synthetase
MIDVPHGQLDNQRKRFEKERDQLLKNIASSNRQLSDEVFLSKARPDVIESMRTKLATYEAQLKKIQDLLNA